MGESARGGFGVFTGREEQSSWQKDSQEQKAVRHVFSLIKHYYTASAPYFPPLGGQGLSCGAGFTASQGGMCKGMEHTTRQSALAREKKPVRSGKGRFTACGISFPDLGYSCLRLVIFEA